MSGHSKWAQIKRSKAVTDAKRGAIFAKISKEIMVAVKLGGPDPASNFRLRFAIEKAKINLVPANNIQRAIEKGAGQSLDANLEEILYEGFGPNGTAILVLCTTDNKNRTVKDLRSYFTKCGGNLAQSGAVSWMFEKCGEIKVSSKYFTDQDEVYELAINAGASDIVFSDGEYARIFTNFEELEKVQRKISEKIKVEESELLYKAKETIIINDEEKAKDLFKLIELIDDHDDVQKVFYNFDIDEKIIHKIKDDI